MPVEQIEGWSNPLLGIRLTLEDGALVVYRPDGEWFTPYVDLRRRLEQERLRAEQAQREAEQKRLRAERLAQRLRELEINPEEFS